ncbi:hypothetical protein D3C78_1526080 [compost metagenome]
MRCIIPVLIGPGSTALTRTPLDAASAAAVRVRPITACLDMMYGASPGPAEIPASEDMLTIAPLPWRFITGSTCLRPRNTPRTLTA